MTLPTDTNPFSRYYQAIQFIEQLSNLTPPNYVSKRLNPTFFLERTRELLHRLGNPEHDLKFIHVGGTAGKGTVATSIQRMLVNQGYRTGLFTSPFVTSTIEKFVLDRHYIGPLQFANLVETMTPVINDMYLKSPYGVPSYFDICVAIALLYFKQQKCDWVVMEVGLGGRYDATNCIPAPKITVITSIDYDHTNVLGKTLTKIAHDKAGIVKAGSHVFTAEQRPHLRRIFQQVAQDTKASLTFVKPQANANEALARAVGHHMNLSTEAIEKGLAETKLPCRFEIMSEQPWVILDGAHSPVKMRHTVHQQKQLPYQKLHLVIAVAADKQVPQIIKEIVPLADSIMITRFEIAQRKPTDPKQLAEWCAAVKKDNASVTIELNPRDALTKAMRQADNHDCVLATGSFFLAGELRKYWYPEDWVLTHRSSFC
jgi:dihydrofolate synthase/folylpolyglutamate synthase